MAEPLPVVDPKEAIAFFRAKGWQIAFSWQDVWQEENVRAFTVAKAMSRDLLEDIRAAVDQALTEGLTLEQFSKELRPRLVARGWWGRKLMADPATGEERVVQLGSPARLRTIYETNLRTSYMAGRWQRIERSSRSFPLLRYVSVMDGRERPQHHDWHGTILPVNDPWWDEHFPPCGWGCRCDGRALNERIMARKGWEITQPKAFRTRDYINGRTGEVVKVEAGIDPGWGYNVGKAPLDALAPAPRLGGIAGEETALSAMLSEDDFGSLKGFFAAFGLPDRAAAQLGTVWHDAAGWPMVISAGLFRRADGRLVRLTAGARRGLNAAARVLTAPDRIGLVWVAGKDGRKLLVRRYTSAAGAVDVAGAFWRWHAGSPRRFDPGLAVWAADGVELAAYDPRQPRWGSGKEGGQWRRTGRPEARAAIGEARSGEEIRPFSRADLGAVSGEAAEKAKAAGVDIRNRTITLDHSSARHIINYHGPLAVAGTDERAMTGRDILNAHRHFNASSHIRKAGTGRNGMQRLEADGVDENGAPIRVIVDVSTRRLALVTILQPTTGGRKRAKARRLKK